MAEEEKKSLINPKGDIESVISFFIPKEKKKKKDDEEKGPMERFTNWVAEWGVSRPVVLFPMFFIFFGISAALVQGFFPLALSWVVAMAPVWAPVTGVAVLWYVWVWYVRSLFLATVKTVLLEVKMPREISKSPRAMEVALTYLWQTGGETTFIDRYWTGSMRAFFSLELVSIGGQVHFYIWCAQRVKDSVETAIYGQYPEVEIVEAEDYASKFVFDPKQHDMFSNDQILEWDDTGVRPIRTYVDYELDKDPKEEFKVDPFAQVIEILSSLQGSEQGWVQIIISSSKGGNDKAYQAQVKSDVQKIRRDASVNPGKEDAEEDDPDKYGFPRPTWKQNELIFAIERHSGKRHFITGVRLCYISKFEDYRSSQRDMVRWIFQPFANRFSNQLRPRRWHGPFDYPWQDFRGIRWALTSRRFLDAYRRRSWFYPPWITPHYSMSVEALASIWHPPSSTVASPGLQRIPSTKSAPPPNLPI